MEYEEFVTHCEEYGKTGHYRIDLDGTIVFAVKESLFRTRDHWPWWSRNSCRLATVFETGESVYIEVPEWKKWKFEIAD